MGHSLTNATAPSLPATHLALGCPTVPAALRPRGGWSLPTWSLVFAHMVIATQSLSANDEYVQNPQEEEEGENKSLAASQRLELTLSGKRFAKLGNKKR